MLKNIFKSIREQKAKRQMNASKSGYTDSNRVFSHDLDRNMVELKNMFGNSEDLVFREIYFGVKKQVKALVIFIEGLSDQKMILDSIIRSLMVDVHVVDADGKLIDRHNLFDDVKKRVLTMIHAEDIYTLNAAVDSVLVGNPCLLIDGSTVGLSINAKGGEKRGIEHASSEVVIRGSQEAFVETLRTNTSMLRRIIKNPNLIFERFVLGRQTHTHVCVAYIRGIANMKIVKEVRERLRRIDIDSVLESGYIEQLIEDSSFSPFATIGNSEKPDKVASKMLEGRVAIICDGTPVVLTVPYMFVEAFQVPDDYYSRLYIVNLMRLTRYLGFFITLTLPALYVAVTTFHQEMIPTVLLIMLSAAREGIPFPVLFEALLSETIFLLIRESGIRMPRATGSAVTIVGTIVMGDAAVTAGLISAPMVIITSLSGVTGLLLPALYNAIVLFRFLLILMGGTFGLYGLVIGLLCILAHMCSLRSFGVPFMAPFAPAFQGEAKDGLFRFPLWTMQGRPQSVTWKKTDREAELQKPGRRRGRR